jgi:hypothetical protein
MLGARFQAMFILINYGWCGLIFCFQKRLQSKIFQARFRAFKVLLLRSFYTNSSLLSILETFCCFQKLLWNDTSPYKLELVAKTLRYRVFESFTQTFYLILRAVISILRKLENKVEKFSKSVACLFSMRKSLYSLESPLIFK